MANLISNISNAGFRTVEGGEIFNDYENNKALSQYSTAIGKDNIAGAKAFTITNWDEDAKTYILDSVEGLSAGDKISIEWVESYSNCATITDVNATENKVTVDNFVIGSDESEGVEKLLFTHEKPYIGTTPYGYSSYAEGAQNIALLTSSHTEGRGNKSLGFYSHTEGRNTTAHYAAHAEGKNSTATGDMSHAEGVSTQASGHHSHAEGNLTISSGDSSHSEGLQTQAEGVYSHAEGSNTYAQGDMSHSEGQDTTASGEASHAEGYQSVASKHYAHAEGYKTQASGSYTHSEGYLTVASGGGSHSEGYHTVASGSYSHAEGHLTTAEGNYSHAESGGHSLGGYSHAEGNGCYAYGENSHAEGEGTITGSIDDSGKYISGTGKSAHAEGAATIARGNFSHTEGRSCEAGDTSHAEGYQCKALPNTWVAHAEGHSTEATGDYSHSEGKETKAVGECAHAEGYLTEASGKYSHANGIGTRATYDAQTTIGKYNANKADTIFEVGNGTYDKQSNAFEVYQDGHAEVQTQGETKESAVQKQYVDMLFEKVKLAAHPIGSYYWSSVNTNPSELFGGEWEQIKDRFVLAAGDTYSAGGTGGEKEVSLIPDNIPNIINRYCLEGGTNETGTTAIRLCAADGSANAYTGPYNSTTISHNNMPPYEVAYCWKRIA